MVQGSWGPGGVLNKDPGKNREEQSGGYFQRLDTQLAVLTSDEQRDLVEQSEPGKQDRVHTPSQQNIAAEPKRAPCQPADEQPQERPVDKSAPDRSRCRPSDLQPGRPRA